MPTLEELLATPTPDQVMEKLLAGLNVPGFPITDWNPGGVHRTFLEATSAALTDLVAGLVPKITAGGLLDWATGNWLTVLAQQLFAAERQEASYTIQDITLTSATGAGPYTVNPGDLIVESAAGRRYVLDEAGTIPAGPGAVVLQFKAESPGAAYSDPGNTITTLVTALPGVTASNTQPLFSSAIRTGTTALAGERGTIVASAVGGTPAPQTVRIVITQQGQVGAATFNYSLNGAPYVSAGIATATYDIPNTNIRLTFANGTVNPSFWVGDVYTFTTPGSPIVEQGRDTESDDSLRARARARWGALAEVETPDKYATWAQEASTQVTKVAITPSLVVPGQVDIVIAGAVNPLGGGVVSAVQAYIDQRAPITELPVVASATAAAVPTAGTVHVRRRDMARVKADAQLAWNAYIAEMPMGGVVRAAELVEALMDAGAVDATGITVNGSSTMAMDPTHVAATLSTLDATLTWVEV